MFFKNLLNYFSQFFFFIANQFRNFYLNSKIYNRKISKISNKSLEYKPSPSLLDCLIKYEKKEIKIEDLYLNSVWANENLFEKDYKNLHSFFWLFSLDLKSSKKITQSVILNWIEDNINYNKKNWEIDIAIQQIKYFNPDIIFTEYNVLNRYNINFMDYAKRVVVWVGVKPERPINIDNISVLITDQDDTLASQHKDFDKVIIKKECDYNVHVLRQPKEIHNYEVIIKRFSPRFQFIKFPLVFSHINPLIIVTMESNF